MSSDLLGLPHKQKDPELYVNLPILNYWHLIFLLSIKVKQNACVTKKKNMQFSSPSTNELNSFHFSFISSEGFIERYLRRQAKCEQETQSLFSQVYSAASQTVHQVENNHNVKTAAEF